MIGIKRYQTCWRSSHLKNFRPADGLFKILCRYILSALVLFGSRDLEQVLKVSNAGVCRCFKILLDVLMNFCAVFHKP